MRHTIRKVFADFEKEEKWLNEMCAKGLALVEYNGFKYTFEDCVPGEYQYRIELLDELPAHPLSTKYIQFLEENGVEFVCSYIRWAYFRADKAHESFNLYTDLDNRINHYKRIRAMLFLLAAVIIALAVINMYLGIRVWLYHAVFSVNIVIALLLFTVAFFMGRNYLAYGKKMKMLQNEKAILE